MRPTLPILAIMLMAACTSQASLDEVVFDAVAKTCGIKNLQVERVAGEAGTAGSVSPFRLIGRLWLEKRARERAVVRHYAVNVPAIIGGIGPYGGENTVEELVQRQAYNRNFDCLSREAARADIAVEPIGPVIVM